MIVRLTVNDNDFSELLERFCIELSKTNCMLDTKYSQLDENNPEDIKLAIYARKQINTVKTALSHTGKDITMDDKHAVEECILDAWKSYVENHCRQHYQYLSSRLDVTFPVFVTEEWNNGERFDIFFTSCSDNKVLSF